ncbi:hypothetical protein [Candidatus Villigracilis saccharophilus]|uniref:hypothetical protein n=1 Tax=Candidatus Villigracilis saccharophilus TaxID=3140684 RepID=UPI0031362F51|nr:hypothetical protein [Anaerolineales bacterium]
MTNTADLLGGAFFVGRRPTASKNRLTITSAGSRELGSSVIPVHRKKDSFQGEIADAIYRYQREIDKGIRKIGASTHMLKTSLSPSPF